MLSTKNCVQIRHVRLITRCQQEFVIWRGSLVHQTKDTSKGPKLRTHLLSTKRSDTNQLKSTLRSNRSPAGEAEITNQFFPFGGLLNNLMEYNSSHGRRSRVDLTKTVLEVLRKILQFSYTDISLFRQNKFANTSLFLQLFYHSVKFILNLFVLMKSVGHFTINNFIFYLQIIIKYLNIYIYIHMYIYKYIRYYIISIFLFFYFLYWSCQDFNDHIAISSPSFFV